eukprot:6965442-Ditylum_brightwellii.AAC.1
MESKKPIGHCKDPQVTHPQPAMTQLHQSYTQSKSGVPKNGVFVWGGEEDKEKERKGKGGERPRDGSVGHWESSKH